MADTLSQALLEASLLSSIPEEDEGSVIIDVDRRTMVLPTGFFFGVYNDKDILKVPFVIPRYYNELDLSEFQITVNYINSAGYGNIYRVTNAEVTDSAIRFKWVTGRGVFVKEGAVRFIVCLRQIGTNGEVEKEFNTTIASANVLKGLEVDENPDPIAYSILAHMEELKGQAEAAVEVVEGASDRIDDAVTEAEQAIAAMYHSPYVAPTAADMLSHDKVYVYTGNETGYTFGNWYYWNGSAFVSGGIYNATAFETDDTLSVEGVAADAGAVGYQLNKTPEVRDSTEEDADLDVCDDNGNVLVRFSDGHVKTKNFDSENIKDEVEELQEDLVSLGNDLSDEIDSVTEDLSHSPQVKASEEADADLYISDENGNVIAMFAGGHIKTKNFDSAVPSTEESVAVRSTSADNVDLDLTDLSGNVLVRHYSGNIFTKNFNSDNGIYEKRFTYTQTAGSETIEHFFPKGSKIALHLTEYSDRERDGIRSNKITYKYTDGNGVVRTLGAEYGYDFPEYTLEYDAVSVTVQFGSDLSYSETTLSFKVYSMASFSRMPNVITVRASGGKDYVSLRDAVEYAMQFADEMNRYEIHIYPGTYDIMSYYSDEEKSVEGFIGLTLSNGISLIGIGHRSEVILTATLSPDDYTVTQRNYVSTINIRGNVAIKNLTIKAENIRYAVHDDKSVMVHQNNTHVFDCVTFIGKNLTSSGDGDLSYGAGGGDLKKLFFYNCDFSDALTLHTSTGFYHEYTAYFENCRARLMQFGDYDSGMPCHIYLKNCAVSRIRLNISGTHSQYMLVEGEGVYGAMVESPVGYVYAIDGVHKFTGSSVAAGTAVKLTNDMSGVEATTAINSIYGISIGVMNGVTYVQTEGWLNSNTLGLSNLSVGDYLTIDANGSVVSGGTTANAIAIVKHVNANGVAFAKLLI